MAYTCDELVGWAQQFFPTLKFSKGPGGENEAFYPVDAEGWITHQADPSVTAPAAASTHHRGTAMYRWRAASVTVPAEDWKTQLPLITAGQITLDAGPQGIGNVQFQARPPLDPVHPTRGSGEGDWFLDFAGWSDPASRVAGQIGYSWKTYKEGVYDPLGLPASSPPPEPIPDDPSPTPPVTFKPDTRGLHAYAEFGALRTIIESLLNEPLPPELQDLEAGKTRIQGGADQLADFLGMTYYMLYPDCIPPDGKLMEGEWEAISVFLRDLGAGTVEPQFAAYSQGYVGGPFPFPLAACKAFADVEKDGARPVAYVAFGSHANYFTALTSEQSVDPGVNWGKVGGYGAAGVVAAIGVALIVGGLLASPIGWVAVIIGVVLLVIAALIALFTWLFTKNDKAPVPPPYDEGPRNDSHPGDGPAAGGGATGTTDPATPPPTPGSAAAGGKVPFVLHPVTADPSIGDPRCAAPSWWSYAGRWGVCVDDASASRPADPGSSSWSNGVWRRWPNGYTLTHRNVEALLDYLSGEIDSKTRTSNTYKPKG